MATTTNDANDDQLPEHLKEPPKRFKDWPLPTAWLLGTKLLGSLRDILLSSVAKVDLRTWMTAGEVIDRTKDIPATGEQCCYIDFLADTGDSQRLVYQMARLLTKEQLDVETWTDGEPNTVRLPRGSMLVMGGDIAYPVSTHRRLLDRIRAPFKWAYDELTEDEKARLETHPVTLLAVPGNHDYYDGLRGFEAMFHAPRVDQVVPPSRDKPKPPSEQQLRLPGYKLAQHASYFAVALPFDWHLWGLDIENKTIDDRQATYFEWSKTWKPGKGQQEEQQQPRVTVAPPPDKLIVVTSRPAFVYQGRSDHAKKVIEPSMERLGLTRAFAHNGNLEDGRVRLDLSGDVHLYERYWGTDHAPMPDDLDRLEALESEKRVPAEMDRYDPPERYASEGGKTKRRRGNDNAARAGAPAGANYASVVSGLGGTFHHPSQIRMGTTPPRAAWPSTEHSAREIGIRLANPLQMFRAGAVGVVGLVVAVACYFLIWQSRGPSPKVNVLDVPFALSSSLSAEQIVALHQLGFVAAMVGIIIVMIGLPIGAYFLGHQLSTPIREMREPTWWWPRLTKIITHKGPLHFVLRWVGANSRSAWMFLTNLVPVAGTVVGWWFLFALLRYLDESVKGFVSVYTIITLLVVAMAALGAALAGQKNPLESWPANFGRRALYLVFGILIALLVIWTPYAWVRLICRNHLWGAIGVVVVILTMVIQLGRAFFPRRLSARRLKTILGFVLLVGGALSFPLCFAHMHGTPVTNVHPGISIGLAAVLGAYFASLWVGWYFCIALQWNAHGNEAGGAARVTDFGEFLRIKLTPDQAEVWAIAVEEAILDVKPRWYHLWRGRLTTVDERPKARVVDHFTVKRSSSST